MKDYNVGKIGLYVNMLCGYWFLTIILKIRSIKMAENKNERIFTEIQMLIKMYN